ncbi:hypothetical protein LCGC14_2826450, partial [marine sediment metagenome]
MTRAASDRSARVILASAGVGAGHNQAAAAIQAALAEADPAVQADFVDSLALV